MKSLTSVLVMLSLATACATPLQSELDAEVRRLCAIDGGVTVYETVVLPPANFDKDGRVKVPAKAYAKTDDAYYYESSTNYYRTGNPEMWRAEYRIIRARDQKVLGKSVVYVRRGGDLPSPMHDSSFACPATGADRILEESIFVRGH